jgi:ABC-2 type transport system permease protein
MNSWLIAANMIKRTMGERKTLLFFIILPAVILSLIVALLGHSQENVIQVSYVMQDQGMAGSQFIELLKTSDEFTLQAQPDEAVMKEQVISQKVRLAFLVPDDFTASLLNGEAPKLQAYYLNISENTVAIQLQLEQTLRSMKQTLNQLQASGYTGEALQATLPKLIAEQAKGRIGLIDESPDMLPQPLVWLTTGILLLFVMSLANSAITTLMEDQRNHTMARIYTAPVRAIEIAVGNLIGSALICALQITIVLLITRYVFGFDYHVSFGAHLLILFLFALVALGIATTIGTIVRHAGNMGVISSVIITPTCMLGGCFWPISFMPEPMQKLAAITPQKWTIDALEQLSGGAGLSDITLNLLVLALMSLVLLGFGAALLRPGDSSHA